MLFIFNCEWASGLKPEPMINTVHTTVHGSNSYVDYRVGVETPGKYHIVLNSDEKRFGGHDRIAMDSEYFTTPFRWNDRANYLQVYLPSRTVLVLGL